MVRVPPNHPFFRQTRRSPGVTYLDVVRRWRVCERSKFVSQSPRQSELTRSDSTAPTWKSNIRPYFSISCVCRFVPERLYPSCNNGSYDIRLVKLTGIPFQPSLETIEPRFRNRHVLPKRRKFHDLHPVRRFLTKRRC